MRCMLKRKDQPLTAWEKRIAIEDFKILFSAYNLEYIIIISGSNNTTVEDIEDMKTRRKERQKQYKQSERGKQVNAKSSKKYRQTDKGKEAMKKAREKYYQTEKGKINKEKHDKKYWDNYPNQKRKLKEYQQSDKGKETMKKAQKKYMQTPKGKIANAKHKTKRRNLKFIPLINNPFPPDIDIEYHHINDIFVIPLPKTSHQNTYGNNHLEKCNIKIQNIFGLDVNELLNPQSI